MFLITPEYGVGAIKSIASALHGFVPLCAIPRSPFMLFTEGKEKRRRNEQKNEKRYADAYIQRCDLYRIGFEFELTDQKPGVYVLFCKLKNNLSAAVSPNLVHFMVFFVLFFLTLVNVILSNFIYQGIYQLGDLLRV